MTKTTLFTATLLLVLLSGCYTQKRISKFTSPRVALGMDIKDFVAEYGKPFNQEMNYTRDHQTEKRLFYKEELYKDSWYQVTTAFTFVGSRLVKQEIVKEERVYRNCDCKQE